MAERDRDEAGRPRNARPRDALGRPMPRGSAGVQPIPDDLNLPPAETLRYAQRLLDLGRAFQAHEVLEAAWKNGPDDERSLWQGLAQLAVGITHVQRGNRAGALALLRRAAEQLGDTDRGVRHGVPVGELVAHAQALAADLEADGRIPQDRLRPQLTGGPTPADRKGVRHPGRE